jgi:hypothetical protein
LVCSAILTYYDQAKYWWLGHKEALRKLSHHHTITWPLRAEEVSGELQEDMATTEGFIKPTASWLVKWLRFGLQKKMVPWVINVQTWYLVNGWKSYEECVGINCLIIYIYIIYILYIIYIICILYIFIYWVGLWVETTICKGLITRWIMKKPWMKLWIVCKFNFR